MAKIDKKMDKNNFTSDVVIGIEVHIELNTKTKLFCGCPTKGDDTPNSRTCEICLGHPGSKPLLNKKAFEYGLMLCLALDCDVENHLIFSRKSYFYPDLAKNYQISQYELPLGRSGKIRLSSGKEIGIERVHIEEDPASLLHPKGMKESSYVLIDYNRSGNPLVEIVTKPELTSAEEARDFMKKLINVLSYLKIFDINKGIIKADANISIKESGYKRAEVKNITGFKDIERALNYEIERQKKDVSEGKEIVLETRGWDSEKGTTFSLRTKETEADYGYIIDPDLVKIEVTPEIIGDIKSMMPELAEKKIEKLKKLGVSNVDAEVIAAERELAELFERISEEIDPVLAAKWLRRELVRVLNYNELSLEKVKIDEDCLKKILSLVSDKKITDNVGKKLIEKLIEGNFDVGAYVKENNLESLSDSSQLEDICKKVVLDNSSVVEDVKSGNEKAINFLIGQVMRQTKGSARPDELKEIFKRLIR